MLLAVALVAGIVFLAKHFWIQPESRYRYVQVFHRRPNGSIGMTEMICIDLDAPYDDFHGLPDGKTRYRELMERLMATKAEYTVRKPRGFTPAGVPID